MALVRLQRDGPEGAALLFFIMFIARFSRFACMPCLLVMLWVLAGAHADLKAGVVDFAGGYKHSSAPHIPPGQ